MMQSVAGKKLLITGAAMGMGRLYAELAVRESAAAVVLWDVNEAALAETAEALRKAGGSVYTDVVDVSRLEAIETAAAKVRETVGDIELLFNNAGIVRGRYFWEHDHRRDTLMTMAVNSLAIMYIAREFLPGMIAAKGECRIVNIASAAGLLANPRMSVYCASKWAAVGWSDSLRLELLQAGHGHVKVTTVCPSYINTGMFDGVKAPMLTPILKPEYVVDRVWRAMKRGTPLLTMPFMVRVSMMMRGLLPVRVWDWLGGRLFGVYRTMEDFHGRPIH